jgi:anti-sigma factor RsiW
VIGRAHHLHDGQLFECYLAERDGNPTEPRAAGHLAGCPECGTRLADLTESLDRLRTDADDEADAIFTPERLRAQQRQIANRLEHLTHSARVISFPVRMIGRRMARTARHVAPRWAVAAAAAGLFIGLGVGTLVAPVPQPAPVSIAVAPPVLAPVAGVNESSRLSDDDTFLS